MTRGVVGYRIADGELHVFRAAAVMFATGGFGRMFRITSNALALTGDGVSHRVPPRRPARGHGVLPVPSDRHLRHGHPAVARRRAARAAILRNDAGERFMERYAPTLMELAPRDMVSRAMYTGDPRGPRHRRQGLRPPRPDPPGQEGHRREAAGHHRVLARLPGHRADHAAGARPANGALRAWAASRPDIDVARGHRRQGHGPPRHLCGGGVRVRVRPRRKPAGHELAHRHPRLTAGAPAGRWPTTCVRERRAAALPRRRARSRCEAEIEVDARLAAARRERARNSARARRADDGSVSASIRTQETLEQMTHCAARAEVALREASRSTTRATSSTPTCSRRAKSATCSTAPRRRSPARSRARKSGRHSREDFPERNDTDWLKHTLAYQGRGRTGLEYKPVTITKFEPKPRTY